MSLNNTSRGIFKKFVESNSPVVGRVGMRNVCDIGSSRYAFSTIERSGKIVVRQFYEDCEGVFCFCMGTSKLYFVNRDKLKLQGAANRITPSGVKAYSGMADMSDAHDVSSVFAI